MLAHSFLPVSMWSASTAERGVWERLKGGEACREQGEACREGRVKGKANCVGREKRGR